MDYDVNEINVYDLSDKKYNKDEFINNINKLLNIKNLLETTNIPIYNYEDVERILSTYNVRISDFTVDDAEYINKIIKLSIRDIKNNKQDFKPIKYETVKLNINERIFFYS